MSVSKPQRKVLEVPRLDPNATAKLKDMGGSNADQWNQLQVGMVLQALPTSAGSLSAEYIQECQVAAASGMADCQPDDPIEGMIVGLLISANSAALELQRRAWLKDQSFECRTRYLALADKSTRTVASLVEALSRYRGKGQQTMRVEHVHIHSGAQAVVGTVSSGGSRCRN